MGLIANHISASGNTVETIGGVEQGKLFVSGVFGVGVPRTAGGEVLSAKTWPGSDTIFFISGSTGDDADNTTSVFGGNVVISGTLSLSDGSAFADVATGAGALHRVAYYHDANTISGSVDFVFNATGSGATGAQGLTLGEASGTTALFFRDEQIRLSSTTDGQLDIDADGEIEMASAKLDVDLTGDFNISAAAASTIATSDGELKLEAGGSDDKLTLKGDHESDVAIHIDGDAATGSVVDIDAGHLDIDASDKVTIDAADEIEVTTTSADGHIKLATAHTAGLAFHIDANANAASEVQIDAGILDVDVTGAATIDAGGSVSIDAAGATNLTTTSGTLTVSGSAAGELQFGNTLDIDSRGAMTIDSLAAVTITGAGVNIAGGSSEVDITTTGALDVNANSLDMDLTDSSSITITSSEAAEDLTIEQVGANDSSIIIQAAGTGADAIKLNASAGSIDIDSADNITVDAADDISITSTSADGLITIHSAHVAGQAVLIDANAHAGSILDVDAGIVDIDAQGAVSIDSSGGAINVGVTDHDQNINIGTDGDRTIVIGKSGGSTTTQIHSDGGTLALDAGAAGTVAITGDATVSRHLTVSGDFTVSGDTTLVNTTNLEVEDALIALNFNSGSSSGPARDAGLVIGNGAHGSLNRVFMWDNSDSEFAFVSSFTAPSGSAAITVKDYQNIKAADIEATGSVTAGGLTEGRVLIAGSNGLITDDAGMTYVAGTNELFVSGAVQVSQLQIDNISNTIDLADNAGGTNMLTINGALGLTGSTTAGGIKLAAAGQMQLGAVGKQIHASNVEAVPQISQIFNTNLGAGACNTFRIFEPAEDAMADLFAISVFDNGVTNISTTDGDGSAGHLTINANGNLVLDGDAAVDIDADGGTLSLDGSGGINIGTEANVAIDVNSTTFDLDAAGDITLTTTGGTHEIQIVSAHTAGRALFIDCNAHAGSIVDIDAGILDIDAAGNVTIDSSAGTISIGADDIDQNINVGTDGDRTIVIGKSGGSTTTQIHSDGGDLVLDAGNQNISTTGDLVPTADNSHDLGSPTARFRNIYTGDLHLANERGNWTLVEESNMLTFRNNLSGKWFRMVMEEIDPSGRDAGMNGAAPMGSEGNPAGDPDWDL